MKRFALLASALALSLGGCVTNSAPDQPAVLNDMDEANTTALKSALAEAMGRANIKLGPQADGPLTQVTVLPPPRGKHEMNSTALPTHFDVVTNGTDCWLVRQDTRQTFPAPGVMCKPR